MPQQTTAEGRWQELSGARQGFISRCELYASYTLPKICPPDNYDQNSHELSHDFQALGAQATNHLSNKIMLASFAPSRPFFRADPDDNVAKQLAEAQISEAKVAEVLSQIEKNAVRKLDQLAMRPKLYEVIKHLIITGNVLLMLDEKSPRVLGLKKYVVRRSASGEVVEIIIGDRVRVDELSPGVQRAIREKRPEVEVNHYRWIRRDKSGDYRLTQWVDGEQLPENFNGKWPEQKLPFRVLTWDLSDGADYGTGLVEDYRADFAALSALSRAQVVGAILASEFRWLVNPAGLTRPEDLALSENGSALPGSAGDIELVQSGKSADLQVTLSISTEYVNRIGRGFLMGGQLVRNAERVTAEEIRLLANELETALGGAYSRLAVDIQLPMAHWLLSQIDLPADGIQPTVVTGLDALSRTGDLEELKALFADLAALSNVPEGLMRRLRWDDIVAALAAARRVKADTFLKDDATVQKEEEAAHQRMIEAQAAQGAIDATVRQASQTPQGQPE